MLICVTRRSGLVHLHIIGNGFDIAHGLPTKYWDFRTFLEQVNPSILHSFEEEYHLYPNLNSNKIKNLFWNELETNLANIDEELILEQAFHIDMGLDGGDFDIVDTLYDYFSDHYKYITLLAKYLKQWVSSISLQDLPLKTSLINNDFNLLFVTFNYTSVLEEIYNIDSSSVIHLHGSLYPGDEEPILGHGNKDKIEGIRIRKIKAEELCLEKKISICEAIEDYYDHTYKNINRHSSQLYTLQYYNIREISIVGHSLAGVDMSYFKIIDNITHNSAKWNVYYYSCERKEQMKTALYECDIEAERIKMLHTRDFFDLQNY